MKRMVKRSVLVIVLLGLLANVGFAAEMKKVIVFVSYTADYMSQHVLKGLSEAGFVEQQNLINEQVLVSASTDFAQLIDRVKEFKPDVIINITEFRQLTSILKKLPVPIITSNGVEHEVDKDGVPLAKVTGVYSSLPDMVYNSYKFLQKVAPLQPGQKAVFFEIPEVSMLPKTEIIDALQRLEIPLKAIVDTTVYEDWQEAVLKYNADPEVGWILRVTSSIRKRDGSRADTLTEVFPWEREHLKKPMVTYWETTVSKGALCGFGIDMNALAEQVGRMAARVLDGENVQMMKAEYPQKISISLNRKTATNLGIVFSLDVLNLANVIFDDYEGKQVIRK